MPRRSTPPPSTGSAGCAITSSSTSRGRSRGMGKRRRKSSEDGPLRAAAWPQGPGSRGTAGREDPGGPRRARGEGLRRPRVPPRHRRPPHPARHLRRPPRRPADPPGADSRAVGPDGSQRSGEAAVAVLSGGAEEGEVASSERLAFWGFLPSEASPSVPLHFVEREGPKIQIFLIRQDRLL